MADAILEALQARRLALVLKLSEIDAEGGHILNAPDTKTTDGGTTLDKQGYIARLEKSLKAVDEAILRHRQLVAAEDAGSSEPFEVHTKIEG